MLVLFPYSYSTIQWTKQLFLNFFFFAFSANVTKLFYSNNIRSNTATTTTTRTKVEEKSYICIKYINTCMSHGNSWRPTTTTTDAGKSVYRKVSSWVEKSFILFLFISTFSVHVYSLYKITSKYFGKYARCFNKTTGWCFVTMYFCRLRLRYTKE